MAKIPTYTSRSGAVSTSGIARASAIPFRDFGAQALAETGKQIGLIADKITQAAEDDAVGQANLNASLKLNDLQAELQTMDPMAAMAAYDDRANAILEESGAGLSANAAARFKKDMQRSFISGKVAVQKDGITRGRQKLEANLVTRMAGLASSAQDTDGDVQYQQRADNALQSIEEAVANRVIAADTGARMYQKYLQNADNARASFDMQRNAEGFLGDLKDGKYLPNLTGEQRARWIEKGNNFLERDRKKITRERDAAEKIAIKDIERGVAILEGGGELTEKLEALFDANNIRAKIFDQEKANKVISLTKDAVVFHNVRNNLKDLDTPTLMALADRFVQEANVDVEDMDLRIQNQRQRDVIIKEISQRVGAKEKAALKKIQQALKAEQNLKEGEELRPEYKNVLRPSYVTSNIRGEDNVASVQKMIVDQKAFLGVIKNLNQMSGAQQAEALAAQRQELSDAAPFDQDREQKQFQLLQKAISQNQELRANDPALAVQSSPGVVESYQRLQKNPTRENYADYAEKRDGEMDRLGIPFWSRKIISKSDAKREVLSFDELQPEQAANRIKMMREMYGDDWPRVLGEMKAQGLSTNVSAMMAVDDDNLRDRLASIIKNGGLTKLRSDAPPFDLKGFNSSLGAKMASVRKASKDKGIAMARSVQDAVEMIARSNIQNGNAASVEEAVNSAYDQVVTQHYDVVDHDYLHGIAPKDGVSELDVGRAVIGLKNWFEFNSDIKFSPLHLRDAMRSGMTAEQIQKQELELIQSNATWQLSPDGSAAILNHNGQPVATEDGKVISVSIDEALALSSAQAQRRGFHSLMSSAYKANVRRSNERQELAD